MSNFETVSLTMYLKAKQIKIPELEDCIYRTMSHIGLPSENQRLESTLGDAVDGDSSSRAFLLLSVCITVTLKTHLQGCRDNTIVKNYR